MPNIHVLIKPASGMCNIQCKYCFYHDEAKNREIESYGLMSEETLEQVIKKTLEFADTACTIAYQGGEPTLRGLDFFQKSIEIQNRYNTRNIKISNALQTNGILLDRDWAVFLKENRFLVGISLDGTAFTHDSFRMDSKGQGTYVQVLEAIELLEEYQVDFNILTVVNALTAKKISQIYAYYKERDYRYLQFIPCLNPIGEENRRYPYTLTPQMYGHFLKTLFDLWYNDFRAGRRVHIQPLEGYIQLLHLIQPDLCGMSGLCSCQHVVEADGEVYPCDFYVMDEYKLGNLHQLSFDEINERRRKLQFIEQSAVLHKDCQSCKYVPICRGGCRRHRLGKNYFCTAYYDFFQYSIDRLEEMAKNYR
ncbi:MAG: anaerobic sulfatase maturase [Lachnospiraceae bacterium]|nr:anaerobic sulfatase maturase [Lachnospiraceae bacterium]